MATLNRLYANIPTNAITDAFAQSIPLLPSDGTLLREESGAIWVVYGGAGFHVPDPTTLTRLFDVAKVRQLWNGALTANGIGLVPRDKTQLREENGAIWIIYGGAGFHVPDPATLVRLYPGTKAGQLWNGAITRNGIGLIPRDGTLLREENGAIWVIYGGAGFHVPDPATLTRLFDPTQVCQLWNGSLTQNGIGSIPRDGTLLREESSNDVYIMSRGHKTITTSFPPENVRVIWNGALSSIP
jgi:hypothetical protein